MFGGASAFAASGLLGQKVQGVFTIEKDGAKIAEAAIINGSAYAPLRAVADATGTDIGIQGKKIIIDLPLERPHQLVLLPTLHPLKHLRQPQEVNRLRLVRQ